MSAGSSPPSIIGCLTASSINLYKKFASVGSKRKFTDLFSDAQSRSDMVATFLAVLELAKDKKVMVSGDGGDTSIELLSADFGDTVSEEWE